MKFSQAWRSEVDLQAAPTNFEEKSYSETFSRCFIVSFSPLKKVWVILCFSLRLSLSLTLLRSKLAQQLRVLLKEFGFAFLISLTGMLNSSLSSSLGVIGSLLSSLFRSLLFWSVKDEESLHPSFARGPIDSELVRSTLNRVEGIGQGSFGNPICVNFLSMRRGGNWLFKAINMGSCPIGSANLIRLCRL